MHLIPKNYIFLHVIDYARMYCSPLFKSCATVYTALFIELKFFSSCLIFFFQGGIFRD